MGNHRSRALPPIRFRAATHLPFVELHDMDLNRNQFFFIGLVVLLLGLQLKFVSAYILNADATQFLAERSGETQAAAASFLNFTSSPAAAHKVLQPPEWLGWCLISVGSVLILHALAMKKPGGA